MNTVNRRLVVEIPETLHRQVRVSAAEKNQSIKDWMIIAMVSHLKREELESKD